MWQPKVTNWFMFFFCGFPRDPSWIYRLESSYTIPFHPHELQMLILHLDT